MATKKADINFEEALSGLEERIRMLESSKLSLDDSLKVFEEAVSLVKICNKKLEMAENRVRVLTESPDGTVTDKPFGVTSDET